MEDEEMNEMNEEENNPEMDCEMEYVDENGNVYEEVDNSIDWIGAPFPW